MMIAAANIAIVTAKPMRKSRYTTRVTGVEVELLLTVSPGWFTGADSFCPRWFVSVMSVS